MIGFSAREKGYYLGVMKPKRQKTSLKRQHDEMGWRVLAKSHAAGVLLPEHKHGTGQLIFAVGGVMLVRTGSVRWIVPPQRALWIPVGHLHSIEMLSRVEMRTVYFQPSLISECSGFMRKNEVHVLIASSLLKELILGLFSTQGIQETGVLMARLLLLTLREAARLPTSLPMPSDEKLHHALTILVATNKWHLQARDIASLAAMSERTFSRRFHSDVGLSFRAWRQRARIIASLDMLTTNSSIKSIAGTMHFASSAAYVAAFRQLLEPVMNHFRGRVRSRRDAVLGAARRSDWASVQASQQRNASLLDRTLWAAPRTGRLRCCSSLPWNHHDASLRLAFGRFSGLRAP